LHEQFDSRIDELPEGFGPRYNAAPLQMLPVVNPISKVCYVIS